MECVLSANRIAKGVAIMIGTMQRVAVLGILVLASALSVPGQAEARLIAGQDIIPAPPFIIDDPPGAVNTHQQAFDERQNVLLPGDLSVDSGIIPAGTPVSSHMIFLNTEEGSASDLGVVWTFDGDVLGVMSDVNGNLEGACSALLGAPGTVYPVPFTNRGLEANDGYTVAGDQITVDMSVGEPGDWIRVVTEGALGVSFDIHPQSCPNPLNVRSRGVLPVAILGTDDFNVGDIDRSTLRLEGMAPKMMAFGDVATPFEGEPCDCHELGLDGYMDLTIKFRRPEIVAAIGPVGNRDFVPLTITGALHDGTPIEGVDCVWIIDNGFVLTGAETSTWGHIKAVYRD
jgi:hypothetical protein